LRRGHTARSPPHQQPAALGARQQRQLAIVPVRCAGLLVATIPARSGGAASGGRSGEHGGGGGAEKETVSRQTRRAAHEGYEAGTRPEPIRILLCRSI